MGNPVLNRRFRTVVIVTLGVVAALGLTLRLCNIGFGLPISLHPDESVKIHVVLRILRNGGDPNYFLHPGFLLYSISAIVALTQTFIGSTLEPETIRLIGRNFVAYLGTASVLVTYFVGRQTVKDWLASRGKAAGPMTAYLPDLVGLSAALFLALTPLHVVRSHYLKEDVPLTFWMLLCMLACLGIVRSDKRRHYILAALCGGMALSTKYTGLIAMGLIPLAHVLRLGRQSFAFRQLVPQAVKGLGLLAIAAAVFLLVNPFALFNFSKFHSGMTYEAEHAFRNGHCVRVGPRAYAWTFHLRYSLWPEATPPLVIAGLLGTALMARRGGRAGLFVALSGLLFYAVHEAAYLKPAPDWSRYMVPVLPILAIAAAFLLLAPLLELRRQPAPRWAPLAAGLAVLLLAALPASIAWRQVCGMETDTRLQVGTWLKENVPPGTTILSTNYGAPPEDMSSQFRWLRYSSLSRETVDMHTGYFAPRSVRHSQNPANVDVFVVSSFYADRFKQFARHSSLFEEARQFYEKLDKCWGPPAKTFAADTGSYGFHNPTIKVYYRPTWNQSAHINENTRR